MSNETDRELLDLAAKAAGVTSDEFRYVEGYDDFYWHGPTWGLQVEGVNGIWNPLEDDGDALRLAVKLNLAVDIARESGACWAGCGNGEAYERCEPDGDWTSATRRAIVRAAAEIGRAME